MKVISTGSTMAWQLAARIAVSMKSQFIEQEHLLAGIFSLDKLIEEGKKTDSKRTVEISMRSQLALESECKTLQQLLDDYKLGFDQVRKTILSRLTHGSYEQTEDVIHRSTECKRMFTRAQELATADGIASFSTLQLLSAIIEIPNTVVEQVLEELHILPLLMKQKLLALARRKGVYATSIETGENDSLDTYCFFPKGKKEAVIILVGKIVGSRDLIIELGELELCCLLEERNQLIKKIIARCGNGEMAATVEEGLVVLFASPADAVESALEIRDVISESDRLKMGFAVRQGTITKTKDARTAAVSGTSIDTARFMVRGTRPGDILVTEDIVNQLVKFSEGRIIWEPAGTCSPPGCETTDTIYQLTYLTDTASVG